MARMKTFFKYFIIFLVVYFLVSIGVFLIAKSSYVSREANVINNSSLGDLGKIEVYESKFTSTNGYVKGNVTNNTNKQFSNKYLKFNFFTKEKLAGTKYLKLEDLQPNESQDFEMRVNYDLIDHVDIQIVDGASLDFSKIKNSSFHIDLIKDDRLSPLLFYAGIIMIFQYL